METKCDTEKMNNNVKPPLNTSRNNLDEAIGILTSISIPGDFSCGGELASIPSNIRTIQDGINNIIKWVQDVVTKFEDAENRNRNLLNQIMGDMSKLDLSSSAEKIGTAVTTIGKVAVADFNQRIEAISPQSIIESVKSLGEQIKSGIEMTGAKISSTWESIYNKIPEPVQWVLNNTAATISSVANVVISLGKGICQLAESLFDFVVILGTGAASVITGVTDGITYLISKETGWRWESITAEMWKGTMSFVATDHVENIYREQYEDNFIWKWIDEHAYEPFKSEGVVSQIASGLGYVAGIIALSFLTFGLAGGGAAAGAGAGSAAGAGAAAGTSGLSTTGIGAIMSKIAAGVSGLSQTGMGAIISGIAGTGKYTAEYWANSRDSSWSGILEMYNNGEISAEDFVQLEAIRNMSEDEWNNIMENYFYYGNISEEDYIAMSQIRNMPSDWTTLENGAKGLIYGTLNGIWEAAQWYEGGKLNDMHIEKFSELTNSVIRVGIDTVFNAFDPAFRAGTNWLIEDISKCHTFGEAWEALGEEWKAQGGWSSVLVSAGVGLIGSAGGEAFDYAKDYITTMKIKSKINKALENLANSGHGFQLNFDDLGESYKIQLKNGFFTEQDIFNILAGINSKGYVDEATGNFLKSLFDGDNKIYIKTVWSSDVDSIMNEGIRCLGLGNSNSVGASIPKTIADVELENTVTDVTMGGLSELIDLLKSANGLSQGGNPINGAMILSIPKDASLEDILKYNAKNGWFNIDPKYNVGFIGASKDGILDATGIPTVKGFSKILDALNNNVTGATLESQILRDIENGIISEESLKALQPEELINRFNKRYPETLVDGVRKFNTQIQIAEYFNDPYGFIASKFEISKEAMQGIDNKAQLLLNYSRLNVEDKNILISLLANSKSFSQDDSELLQVFSKYAGPIYSAYTREANVQFGGAIFDGIDGTILKDEGIAHLVMEKMTEAKGTPFDAINIDTKKAISIAGDEINEALDRMSISFYEELSITGELKDGMNDWFESIGKIQTQMNKMVDVSNIKVDSSGSITNAVTQMKEANDILLDAYDEISDIINKLNENSNKNGILTDMSKKIQDSMENVASTIDINVDWNINKQFDSFEKYVEKCYEVMKKTVSEINIENDVIRLDKMIEGSTPLAESILVTRNVDGIFKDGEKILIFSPGTTFDDKAIFSTSANSFKNPFANRKIKLEIEVPKGQSVAYIEPEVAFSGGTGYSQQEILLGRNSTYEIIDVPRFDSDGRIVIRARIS